ncbi:hypothetical protein XAC439_12120008 [Xanthomonas citri pv. citri]|nr:hypothetical protein XAC439_12120008 [Xanthomonas citri pv. citri]
MARFLALFALWCHRLTPCES